MKILNTGTMYSELSKNRSYSFPESVRKKTRANEFSKILEETFSEMPDDPEEFQILLPKHGHFWDNGYEDIE